MPGILRAADAFYRDFVHRFIEQMDFDLYIFSEALLSDHVVCESRQAGQSVAGQHAAPVSNHVSVVVILGRLYKIEMNFLQHMRGNDQEETYRGSGLGGDFIPATT